MSVDVVGLGAWCDYETVDDYRARLARSGPPSEPPGPGEPAVPGLCVPDEETFAAFERQANFRVEEFATLSDGRRLTLTDDRGWGVSGSADIWSRMTVESVEADVNAVLLPDDAEETGDERSWAWLAQLVRGHGVDVTPEALRRLPFDIVLSDRLRERLSANG